MAAHRKRKLRTGFTTGTAAAAATKAALRLLLTDAPPRQVSILLLTGDRLTIPVHYCERQASGQAACLIIKDAGDDPDVTHKAHIGAQVALGPPSRTTSPRITITGGTGVGRVTKPGLEVPPGRPAINPGPQQMITIAAQEELAAHHQNRDVAVTVIVPEGERLARKTLNARLGIIGGISILGTTGLVKPLSHKAYQATIAAALSVAHATHAGHVILTTGRRSERFAQTLFNTLPEQAFIQIGDYFQNALQTAAETGLPQTTLAVFFAKAVKMAQGIPHTHAAKARLTLDCLARWALEAGCSQDLADTLATANTARHAFDILQEQYPALIGKVGHEMQKAAQAFAGPTLTVHALIFDYTGQPVYHSRNPKAGDP